MEYFSIPSSTGEITCNHGTTGKKVYCKQIAPERYCIWEEGSNTKLICTDTEVFDFGRFVGHFGVDACLKTDPEVIEMELRGIDWELKHRGD